MNRFHRLRHLHFIGIGGSGMNGIAKVLLQQGYKVTGSDLQKSVFTTALEEKGATIFEGHDAQHIQGAEAVVTSSAITSDNPELLAAKAARIPVIPRAEMLAELMRFQTGIAIAGTHGKTTTTSLLAHLLTVAGEDPTYVIGGRLNQSGNSANFGKGNYFVAEADESDASFLYLQPTLAIVTNIEADHMETYDYEEDKLHNTFIQFIHHLPFYGTAILCADDKGVRDIIPSLHRRILSYGIYEPADIYATDLKAQDMQMHFVLHRPKKNPLPIILNLAGHHNVQNALAVVGIAEEIGISDEAIIEAFASFAGVGRRCQMVGHFQQDNYAIPVIDDYGHHPTELKVTREALAAAFPNKRIVTVFQPHRFSRTQDLWDDFISTLSTLSPLVLLDIYPAGEKPIVTISSPALCNAIASTNPVYVNDNTQLKTVLSGLLQENDILLMQGAGTITHFAKELCS